MLKATTAKLFIQKANILHKNKYDYSEVIYKNTKTPVIIICPKHNNKFRQTPKKHLQGKGCQICGVERKYSPLFLKQLILEFQKKYKNFYSYNYSQIKEKYGYKTSHLKIPIECPVHQTFYRTIYRHKKGEGCPKCKINKRRKEALKKILIKFKKVHGGRYDYSQIGENYINEKKKIPIICKKENHGIFYQTAKHHSQGKGCPVCKNSKGENTIKQLLEKKELNFIQEKQFDDLKGIGGRCLRFDFGIYRKNNLIVLLEYQGSQHFFPYSKKPSYTESFLYTIEHDEWKRSYCARYGIPLETIDYNENTEKKFEKICEKYGF